MSDPLSLVPFALAAREGVIDGWPVRQLVSAGVGLLRRSAPLVRALAAKRSAILLPPGPAMFTALAASDGRAALLLDPSVSLSQSTQLERADIGAVYTADAFQLLLPPGVPRVLLDGAPHRARFVDATRALEVDLAMHEGITLEGDPDAPGSNEEMLWGSGGPGEVLTCTHADALALARASLDALAVDHADHALVVRAATDVDVLACGEFATLLAGGRVTSGDPLGPVDSVTRIDTLDISLVIGRAAALEAILDAASTRAVETSVRAFGCVGDKLPDAARLRWKAATGRDVPWFTLPGA